MASFVSRFTKFLGKHSTELNTTAAALQIIAAALPLERNDKRVVANAVSALSGAGLNIANSLDSFRELSEVEVPPLDLIRENLGPDLERIAKAAAQAAAEETAKLYQERIDALEEQVRALSAARVEVADTTTPPSSAARRGAQTEPG